MRTHARTHTVHTRHSGQELSEHLTAEEGFKSNSTAVYNFQYMMLCQATHKCENILKNLFELILKSLFISDGTTHFNLVYV